MCRTCAINALSAASLSTPWDISDNSPASAECGAFLVFFFVAELHHLKRHWWTRSVCGLFLLCHFAKGLQVKENVLHLNRLHVGKQIWCVASYTCTCTLSGHIFSVRPCSELYCNLFTHFCPFFDEIAAGLKSKSSAFAVFSLKKRSNKHVVHCY